MKRLYDFSLFPLTVTIIGILFTGLITFESVNWISKAEKERFISACNQTTLLIQKKLESNVQLLLSASALFDASENVTAKEWKIFADKHTLLERFHGLQALGYAPRTEEAFSVVYVEPLNLHNQKGIGYNMASEPVRKSAIDKAAQSGEVSCSSKIELVIEKEPDEKPGFNIYVPLYEKDKPLNSSKERMEAIRGVVFATMKAKTLFGDTLGAHYIMLDFEIYDGTTPIEVNLLYDTNPKLMLPRLERYTIVEFYGKKWTLYFKADKALDIDFSRYVPLAGFIFGLLFSIIVGLWMYALQQTRKEAYAIAEDKTQKLLSSNYQLEKYMEIIDANVIVSSTDCKGIITEVSEAFCKISGYSKEELIGQSHHLIRHPDMPASLYKELWERLLKGLPWRGDMKNLHKDGSAYWVDAIISPRYDESGVILGYTAIRQDITDKKRIEEISIRDPLTGLYNRLKLDELFARYISLTKRHKGFLSIIMLDIDKFKLVNDTYGHQVGDMLLQQISKLLRDNLRLEDALGRWGGEEFFILLPSTSLSAALSLAELLRESTQKFIFPVVGTKTISLGVATFHEGDDEKSMIGRADEALYKAKANGRNRVETELYM